MNNTYQIDIRDYFAAKALPLAIKYCRDKVGVAGFFDWSTDEVTDYCQAAAELAYTMADAMMAERVQPSVMESENDDGE